MTTALLVSNVLLWAIVVVMAGVILALTRQIGVLYERIAPVGALVTATGPRVGVAAPALVVETLAGGERTVGGARADGRSTLVLFLSPTCPVCKELLPAVRSMRHTERAAVEVVLASDGPPAEHRGFVQAERLEEIPYVLSSTLGMMYQVGKLPYAVLIDPAGVVRAKGLVNTREHLESLLEAQALGVASIQDYLQEHGHAPAAGGTAA